MRYFFLLLLVLSLCTCGRAQLQITASLAPAEDFCSGTDPDPNVDCINVPAGNDNLTYLPGEDGDLLFTYRIINQSGKFIRQVLATDSRFGTFFPTQTLTNNIPPGATVPLNVIYDALTTPEFVNGVVTLTVEYVNGSSEQVTGNYTLNVASPIVTTEFSLVRKIDACPTDVIAPVCGAQNYGNFTINVGATDTVVTRFNWTNSGESTFDESILIDQDGVQLANTDFDMVPGQTLISAQYIVAPALPGTYPRSQTITVTDFGGNIATQTVNYTIIVEAPELETAFSLVRKIDACPTDVIAPVCGAQNYGNFTINVGATDTVVTRFDWENAGLGTFDESVLTDQDGEVLANTGFNQVTGQRLISAQYIVAPALPGTYPRSQTITVTDFGGNIATQTVNYTIIVEAPELETAFSLVRKKDACPGDIIAPVCGAQNYGNFSLALGAGDTAVTRFDWENAGLGTFDESLLTDQDGEVLANTGFNQVTGQRLISAQYIVAPAQPGTYNLSQTITVTDFGGNTATQTINYTLTVDCSIGDYADPVAICRDRTFTILDGETRNINAGAIDNGSFDGCGDLAGGGIDISSFTCDDEGPNTVTLTVGDLAGNSASCTATVTINVVSAIFEGANNNCASIMTPVTGGQNWWRLEGPNGKIVAEVIIGNNTNIKNVRTEVYKTGNLVDNFNGVDFLSKRIALTMLDGNLNEVQPNNEPVYVRLYYTEAEFDALMAADPASDLSTFVVVKNDGTDCGSGYTGVNAVAMNTTLEPVGCDGQNGYFEFFTGSFSTFYLFPTDVSLPVELTDFTAVALDKQRVQLDWNTQTESGNSHFVVERSTDGRRFEELGAVAGAGESYEERSYSYTDDFAITGVNYYRLRQVDLDGTEALSEVRLVNVSGENALSVYPNPVVNELRLAGFEGGPVTIFDANGREMLRTVLADRQALAVGALTPGVYLVRAGQETLRWVKR